MRSRITEGKEMKRRERGWEGEVKPNKGFRAQKGVEGDGRENMNKIQRQQGQHKPTRQRQHKELLLSCPITKNNDTIQDKKKREKTIRQDKQAHA